MVQCCRSRGCRPTPAASRPPSRPARCAAGAAWLCDTSRSRPPARAGALDFRGVGPALGRHGADADLLRLGRRALAGASCARRPGSSRPVRPPGPHRQVALCLLRGEQGVALRGAGAREGAFAGDWKPAFSLRSVWDGPIRRASWHRLCLQHLRSQPQGEVGAGGFSRHGDAGRVPRRLRAFETRLRRGCARRGRRRRVVSQLACRPAEVLVPSAVSRILAPRTALELAPSCGSKAPQRPRGWRATAGCALLIGERGLSAGRVDHCASSGSLNCTTSA